MTGRMRFRFALLVLLLAPCLGCAAAKNYADPAGPRYETSYAAAESAAAGDGTRNRAPDRAPDRVRVVTYNIQYALNVDEAIEALKTSPDLRNPDLLLLQEMDGEGVARIARALGMNSVYYPASVQPRTKRDFGNAILSPWPIGPSRKIILPHPSRVLEQGRAPIVARVEIAGRSVRVYSVHLGSPSGISEEKRRDQTRVVLEHACRGVEPVVVGGDFNSKGVGWMFTREGFTWTTGSVGRTSGPFSIDHIFTRGFSTSAARQAGVVREPKDVSDHLPVWAELVLPETGTP